MPFITFLYRIGNRTFYGTYTGYISDDHNGLASEVSYRVKETINNYRVKKGLNKLNNIRIGVIGYSYDCNDFSTEKEIKCFDLYLVENNYKTITYINGKIIA